MNRIQNLFRTGAWLALLGALTALLVLLFRAAGGLAPLAGPLVGTAGLIGTQPPPETPPARATAPLSPTLPPFAFTATADKATQFAQITASAPAPLADGGIVYDPVNRFSLKLMPGWYATVPDAKATVGVTTISNYDVRAGNKMPPGGLLVQISVGQLEPGRTFEQWLLERRQIETSPDYGASRVTLTEPQPYALGEYAGFVYMAYNPDREGVMVVYLLTSDKRIVGIGLRPVDSPALADALSMMSGIEISPR